MIEPALLEWSHWLSMIGLSVMAVIGLAWRFSKRSTIGAAQKQIWLGALLIFLPGSIGESLAFELETQTQSDPDEISRIEKLHTTTFRVDPQRFLEVLVLSEEDRLNNALNRMDGSNIQVAVREYFRRLGVPFPEWNQEDLHPYQTGSFRGPFVRRSSQDNNDYNGGSDAKNLQNQRAVYFNHRVGILYVRATLPELGLIEETLSSPNKPIPQVELEVVRVEMDQGTLDQLARGSDVLIRDQLGVFSNPPIVLSPDQYESLLDTILEKTDAEIKVGPKVTTSSSRRVEIRMVESLCLFVLKEQLETHLKSLNATSAAWPEPIPSAQFASINADFGATLLMTPSVNERYDNIEMEITLLLREFLGYADPPIEHGGVARNLVEIPAPAPSIGRRRTESKVTILDGQTFIIGPVSVMKAMDLNESDPTLASHPSLGRLFRPERPENVKSHMLFLLTASVNRESRTGI